MPASVDVLAAGVAMAAIDSGSEMTAGEAGQPLALSRQAPVLGAQRAILGGQPRDLRLEHGSAAGAAVPPGCLPLRGRQGHIPSLEAVT